MMSTFLILGQTNGFVLDSEHNPIEKVSVYLVDQKIILYTNENGIFLVDQETPDNSSVYFYKLGYASKLVKYQKDIQFKVILEKLHVTLDEVGVTESFNELGNSRLTNIEKKSIEIESIHEGEISNITEFGLFIKINEEIDGLVHINDLSWGNPPEEEIKKYKKGSKIKSKVLEIDPTKERIA